MELLYFIVDLLENKVVFFYFFFLIVISLIPIVHKTRIKIKIKKLASDSKEITPEEFFKLRNASNGKRGHISTNQDFSGVYILYNHTKKLYYVGQGQKLFQRVNQHFTGHGNGDVYADYKYGDVFTIRMIALKNSGFKTLNELERNAILTYNSYYKGYNKTRGNRG